LVGLSGVSDAPFIFDSPSFCIDGPASQFSLHLMNQTTSESPPLRARSLPLLNPWLVSLILLGLLFTFSSARAADPNDEYLNIYGLVQQADTLSANGQIAPAIAKYREAQLALRSFQKNHVGWNSKVVAFRLNYVGEKIATLSEKGSMSTVADPSNPKGQGGSKAQAVRDPSQPQVKRLNPGAEPRKVLRLHPKPGDKQTLVINTKMTVEMKMGELQNPPMKLPTMSTTMETLIKSVSTEGDINYETVITDAGVADEPGVSPMIADPMKSALAKVKGLTGAGIISDRGFFKTMDSKVTAGTDAQTRQMMDQINDSFSRVATPLPEEAVGPGAKWEVRAPVKSQGMTIDQKVTYELVSLEGERAGAKATLAQNASNQKIENPMMPGVKVDVTKMTGTGSKDITFDLAQLFPPVTTVDAHSELNMSIAGASGLTSGPK
jgi:hypothetical protein